MEPFENAIENPNFSSLRFTVPPTVSPNPNPGVPLAALLRFCVNKPVRTVVSVSDGERQWDLHFDRPPERGLPILGMRPGRRHVFRVSIVDVSGSEVRFPHDLTFTTPPLPAGREAFPPLQVTVSEPARMEPGVTLLSVRRRVPGQPDLNARYGLLLAVDAQGEVVWFYRTDVRISDVTCLWNGNLLYMTADFRAIEIDWLGNVVASWYAAGRPQGPAEGIAVDTLTFHHHMIELPSGNLLVLGSELREVEDYWSSETDPLAPRQPAGVMGDEIVEFRRDGTVVWQWRAFDKLDPYRIGYDTFFPYWTNRGFPGARDWTHGNRLYYDAREDALIVSLRMQDAVLNIDRTSGEIRWIAGDPSGWPAALQDRLLSAEGGMRWFYHQHASSLTPSGTLLLYDNGNHLVRPFTPAVSVNETYSRAVEYAVDTARGTLREVWASDEPGPEAVVTYAMGEADYLSQTGNVLVSYGLCLPQGEERLTWDNALRFSPWTRVREMTHTTPPHILWEVVLRDETEGSPVGWTLFGAQRLSALPFHRDLSSSGRQFSGFSRG